MVIMVIIQLSRRGNTCLRLRVRFFTVKTNFRTALRNGTELSKVLLG
uniref:Uncharacterized protein n=1 Tax=Anguilla anguilla TaxID=7936 RepID=A0A0E9V535_ANGAN